MPKLTVLADGVPHEVQVPSGITLIDACSEAGVELLHSCSRGSWCGTCVVHVLKGGQHLSPVEQEELDTMEREGMTPAYPETSQDMEEDVSPDELQCRLSCSCQVFGSDTDELLVRQPLT